ncbi:phosphatidate cytidylyltransferase [Methylocystis echinoides]|uniref:Phosphatidate cytidylyltransferase n=1 Tax=Methylocystis echinoides TaxID=29468 RepID=A0A9W6GVU8_9HYPH|nr:phosphatidate cytidylyltransferase [Methylocystis echinoides]GLI93795.1 phosphatidate cytidylyltransferase [Methylocystis echinoides]
MSASPKSAGAGSGGFADLGVRIASAVVMVAAAAVTLYLGGVAFTAFWLLAGLALNWEWQNLVGGERLTRRIVLGGIAVASVAMAGRQGLALYAALDVAALAIAAAAWAGPERRLWAAAGVIYASAPVFAVCWLRESPDYGLLAIAFLFAVVWGTDIFAYFGGRLIGGPKLWPRVSAGKTWSGTITGVLSGAALGLATVHYGGGPALAGVPVFLVGLAAAAFSQMGDLTESAVKRRFGVKDSSQLIPGHGGVMDRLDGFIFASVLVAAIGLARGGGSAAANLFLW